MQAGYDTTQIQVIILIYNNKMQIPNTKLSLNTELYSKEVENHV